MKKVLICALLIGLAGCGEFGGGVVAGGTAVKLLVEEKERDFVAAVNEIDAVTAEINAALKLYNPEVKDETMAAIAELKKRVDTKDPITWVAIASILGNALWGGTAIKRKTG